MPHIIIEYSANVADAHDMQALVDTVHQAGLDHGFAPLTGLRTRAVRRTEYRVADGDPRNAFVAIVARIGPGRSDDVKRSLVQTLIDTAESSLEGTGADLAIAYSAEVQEIDADFRVNRNHIADRLSG